MKTQLSTKKWSLYCWRKFQLWHERTSKADAKARYWLKKHNESQTP